ncbi:MAG: hypothetical protein ACYTEQ_05510 [Planctomycetota bacterium]|jgi:uncharacterized protein YbcC (UPF0753/DUF2309 family)
MNAVEAQARAIEPDQETVDRFFSVYATYFQAFHPAWSAPEIQQDVANAYQAYAQVLQELMEHEIRKRITDAWNSYMAIIEGTLSAEEVQAHLQESYQNYLKGVQQAWVETDLEGINALTLAAISQSLSMASWLTAAATGVADRLSAKAEQSTPTV